MFDNYLNIFKLIFIWINLDLKLVLKKINFKLILFHSKISSFILYLFTTCQLSSAVVHRRSPSWSTIIHRRLSSTAADYHRWPCLLPFAAIVCHHLLLPATTICRRCPLPPFVVIAASHHQHLPWSATVCRYIYAKLVSLMT